MELREAARLARSLMNEHGLTEWVFMFDHSKVRFGCCKHNRASGHGIISLSGHLVVLNDEGQVRDTVLHEVAHALAGPGTGHGPRWKAQARQVGCSATRCYGGDVVTPPKAFVGTCPGCDLRIDRHRRKRIACGRCCRAHNGGAFTDRFLIRWERVA